MPYGIRNHEKTISGAGGEPTTVKTGNIYLDPAPRYSGKSNWEQYREKFEAIVCLNGWDDVTAAIQLLSHLDGDALNVALLVPESQRALLEFLMNSLSDHYNSPGRRAEYKRQLQRVVSRSEDDPSVFAIELETLARRAFMDVDLNTQLQMVRDRFIDGQADRSLRRHLASLKLNTPMIEMVDSCRILERHCEPEIRPRMGTNKGPVHMAGQVAEDRPIPAIPSEIQSVEAMIRKLLPTPATPTLQAALKDTDMEILVRQLMEMISPPMLVAQERPPTSDVKTPLFNRSPKGAVTEGDSAEGYFSCGEGTHNTEKCRL